MQTANINPNAHLYAQKIHLKPYVSTIIGIFACAAVVASFVSAAVATNTGGGDIAMSAFIDTLVLFIVFCISRRIYVHEEMSGGHWKMILLMLGPALVFRKYWNPMVTWYHDTEVSSFYFGAYSLLCLGAMSFVTYVVAKHVWSHQSLPEHAPILLGITFFFAWLNTWIFLTTIGEPYSPGFGLLMLRLPLRCILFGLIVAVIDHFVLGY